MRIYGVHEEMAKDGPNYKRNSNTKLRLKIENLGYTGRLNLY